MKYEVEVAFHKDFVKVEGNKIFVGLISKPENGKANLELIKKLAKHFKISSSKVKIVAGLKSRRKIVEIMEEF
ncbi:MAG: DUF167 domain-containing protein [Candidatus Bathyarchaeia archaeon]